MTPPQAPQETGFILFADILSCFRRHLIKILLITLLFSSLSLFLCMRRPVRYMVEATYRDTGGGGKSGGVMQTLLRYVGVPGDHRSSSTFKSCFLLLEVIEQMGLQATVDEETKWEKLVTNVKENWKAEQKKQLQAPDCFAFRHVKYDGEKQRKYTLIFTSPLQFEIYHAKRGIVAAGTLGENVRFDEISMTLLKAPLRVELGYAYPLSITPKMAVYETLREDLDIANNLKDGTLYDITYPHRDQELAKQVINVLMEQYQSFLKKESDRVALEQIAYLERRKNELCAKMDEYLGEHVAYLKENMGNQGFLSLSQHLQLMSGKKQHFLDKQLAIDTEEKRLDYSLFGSEDMAMGGELASLQNQIHGLKKQRDSIDLAFLFGKKKRKASRFQPPYTYRDETLFTYLGKLEQIEWDEDLIEIAEKGEQSLIPSLFPTLFSTVQSHDSTRLRHELQRGGTLVLSPSASELKKVRQKKEHLQKWLTQAKRGENKDLSTFIQHHIRLTDLQENILKERLFYPQKKAQDLQGIDLNTARNLYHDYIRERDGYESKIRQLDFSKNHLEDPNFEYISLAQILPDGVSQDLARSMGKLVQSMRDKRHLTERDLERMERQFKKQREDLVRHIDQTVELFRMQIELTNEHMSNVQSVILDLLNQEISLIEQQIVDRIALQKNALQVERELVTERLGEIETDLMMVPDQWLKEHQLQFSGEMNLSVLEGMVQLVESKNVEHNLTQIQSQPLDLAFSSFRPIPPRLKTFLTIGVLFGLVLGWTVAIGRDYVKGFPLTLKNLKVQGRKTCGRFRRRSCNHLEEMGEQDLHVLRELSANLPSKESGMVVSLLTSGKSRYCGSLAELLSLEGKKVLLLDLDASSKERSSLFAYLNEEVDQLPIRQQKTYATLAVFEKSRFQAEFLKNPLFKAFLEDIKKDYDVIVLQSRLSLGNPIGRFLMSLSDFMSLTLTSESIETLLPYFDWEDRGNAVAFVTA